MSYATRARANPLTGDCGACNYVNLSKPDIMSKNGTVKIRPNQARALEVYLATGDVTKATEAADVGRSTFYRWQQTDPAFQAALNDATAQAVEAISVDLVRLGNKSIAALESVFDDESATHYHKLKAAEIVITNLLKLRELVTIEARLEALETRANGQYQYPAG